MAVSTSSRRSFVVSIVSLFSGIFNFTCIGYVLSCLATVYPVLPSWATSSVNSAALWGSVLGMCVIGYVGDCMGRSRGMTLTLFLVLLGSVGSAVITWGEEDVLLRSLIVWRFVLGIGVGGVFPLSAVSASESCKGTTSQKTARVGYVFLAMPAANTTVPLVVFVLLEIFRVPSVSWRVILAFGAVPAAVVFFASLGARESEEFTKVLQERRVAGSAARVTPQDKLKLFRAFLGTAGSWFILDVAWYGLSVCMPAISREVFGTSDKNTIALWNALILSITVPANLIVIWLAADERLGRRCLQILSFCAMAITFSALGFAIQCNASRLAVVALYVCVVMTTNCGCGLTTYVLPQEVFPIQVRSTMNGLSAAAGKIGGAIGVTLFTPVSKHFGMSFTMYAAATCQIIGAIITYSFVPTRPIEIDD